MAESLHMVWPNGVSVPTFVMIFDPISQKPKTCFTDTELSCAILDSARLFANMDSTSALYFAPFQPSQLQGHTSDPGGLGRTEQHAEIGRAWCESSFCPIFPFKTRNGFKMSIRLRLWRPWLRSAEALTRLKACKIMRMLRSTSWPTKSSSSTSATTLRRTPRWAMMMMQGNLIHAISQVAPTATSEGFTFGGGDVGGAGDSGEAGPSGGFQF